MMYIVYVGLIRTHLAKKGRTVADLNKIKLKVFVDKHSCSGNCGCHQLKTFTLDILKNNLYKCHTDCVMFQDKRPSLLLTFVKRMKLLALICFKFKGTSGLTGNRGHRGHTVLHEERPS